MAFPATGMFVQTWIKSLKASSGFDTPLNLCTNGAFGVYNGCSLYTNSVTTDLTTNVDDIFTAGQFFSNEISGAGYSTTGYLFPSQTFAHTSGGVVSLTSTTNPNWTGSTLSNVQGCVYWCPTLVSTVTTYSGILAYNFGTAVSTVSGTLTIQLASSTIFTIDLIP